jgi:hypothetical protein
MHGAMEEKDGAVDGANNRNLVRRENRRCGYTHDYLLFPSIFLRRFSDY